MTVSSTGVPAGPRLLDALAVEAALVGRRPLDQLQAAEAAEVTRILRRRAATTDPTAGPITVSAGSTVPERHVRGASA
ncbi:hypothetical protein UK23_11510 [Lentzea aerocolonigenes]|uniref:Uncharacterized protein n=1 Tax=Lentzea aerocolonigenes TaxID=68170 RepID=A0A0F0H952_LENAE|nr:hypothetical protein [Lentzea aerocolonigenes]KJK50143.1 hypothetical protein UK23_11510 [Lentzea aerocolonigenes]